MHTVFAMAVRRSGRVSLLTGLHLYWDYKDLLAACLVWALQCICMLHEIYSAIFSSALHLSCFLDLLTVRIAWRALPIFPYQHIALPEVRLT
jgi:hypothetical protein